MSKAAAAKVWGMGCRNWTAKISLVLIFTLVFSTFLNEGLYQPKSAEAAPVALLDNGGANWSAGLRDEPYLYCASGEQQGGHRPHYR